MYNKKKVIYSNEYGSPVCTIQSRDIDAGQINLISAFSEVFSSSLKFCNKCNKKPASYYSKEIYMKNRRTGIIYSSYNIWSYIA